MPKTTFCACLLGLSSIVAFGQTPTQPLRFDVVSVKRSPDSIPVGGSGGGPGTSDPTHIRYLRVTIPYLLQLAYASSVDARSGGLSGPGYDQISGPAWLESERYDVIANVPQGATKEQVCEMWKNLLADRFHLALHHTTKEFPGYELVVAKGGPKLRESLDENSPRAANQAQTATQLRLTLDKDGFPIVPPGRKYLEIHPKPRGTRLAFRDSSISELAEHLRWPLSSRTGNGIALARVEDKTGLTGKYDFTLRFSGLMISGGAFYSPPIDSQEDEDGGGPGLFVALESQLGLKVVSRKLLLDQLVIDNVDKVPTDN